MTAWILRHGFALIAGPIVGVLTYYLHDWIQQASAWVCESPAAKRALAILLPAILTPLAALFGQQIPDVCRVIPTDVQACLAGLGDKAWLAAALGVVVGQVAHQISKHGDGNDGDKQGAA